MAMTWNERKIKQLLTCLEHTEAAHRLAKNGIKQLRQLLKNHETAIHLKEHYRKQMRLLRRIAKGTKRETEIIQSLILKLRGDTTPPTKMNAYAPKA
jgi:ectoine hydroxylase-related dioxygenase (phytanoyl-CoA dioxygenase family)